MDRDDYRLIVPPDFDDSDADSQVHPMARLMFAAQTDAEAFGLAQQWVASQDVKVIDVSWHHWTGEEFPVSLTIYFTFQYNPYNQEPDPPGSTQAAVDRSARG